MSIIEKQKALFTIYNNSMLKRKNPPIRTAQTKTNKHIDDLLVLRVQLTQAKSIFFSGLQKRIYFHIPAMI